MFLRNKMCFFNTLIVLHFFFTLHSLLAIRPSPEEIVSNSWRVCGLDFKVNPKLDNYEGGSRWRLVLVARGGREVQNSLSAGKRLRISLYRPSQSYKHAQYKLDLRVVVLSVSQCFILVTKTCWLWKLEEKNFFQMEQNIISKLEFHCIWRKHSQIRKSWLTSGWESMVESLII